MAKKQVGLARPERIKVTIKGDRSWDSYVDALHEAALLHKDKTIVRIHTDVVRDQTQGGRNLNARRTVGWIVRRTFYFE